MISHSFASPTRKRYYQHLKIKSVSPHSLVLSSMYFSLLRSKINNAMKNELSSQAIEFFETTIFLLELKIENKLILIGF